MFFVRRTTKSGCLASQMRKIQLGHSVKHILHPALSCEVHHLKQLNSEAGSVQGGSQTQKWSRHTLFILAQYFLHPKLLLFTFVVTSFNRFRKENNLCWHHSCMIQNLPELASRVSNLRGLFSSLANKVPLITCLSNSLTYISCSCITCFT